MIRRTFWIERVEAAWRRRSVVWLAGVRRVGKTFLCRSLPRVDVLDCELPRVRRILEDPEGFLRDRRGGPVVLDEIHRLANPSEILKIAADHFPGVRILATGSSTLAARAKFRDTLAGRKEEVWLTPMISPDLEDFGAPDLGRRLLHGGLPPFFLSASLPERDAAEWMDAYWAKDVQELFRLERRHSFQRFFELLTAQSGGIFEASRFAPPCEVSRATITNYLAVLETTLVAHVVRPFSRHASTEITSAPKVYAFDTGFVCALKGWTSLRREDLGFLWEHFVLNELQARFQTRRIRYWRDKRGHKVDFVWPRTEREVVAVECKWSADEFDPSGMRAFRRRYPSGDNFVVARDVGREYRRSLGDLDVRFVDLGTLAKRLRTAPRAGGTR